MERNDIVLTLQSLLFMKLLNDSPVLSGNMVNHIGCELTTPSESRILIEAPFYDMKKWKKEGVIMHTGEVKKGYTDYASLVNELGGFAKHNRSEGWVNRSVYSVVLDIANMIGAEVICEVNL